MTIYGNYDFTDKTASSKKLDSRDPSHHRSVARAEATAHVYIQAYSLLSGFFFIHSVEDEIIEPKWK